MNPGWATRAVEWGLPAALIVLGVLALETGRENPTLHLLGDASYPMYLSHSFTLGVMGALWVGGSVLLDTAMFCAAMAASAIVGILSFRLIERPMIARPSLPRRKPLARLRAEVENRNQCLSPR
jgi:exopolysaccharide production protein ExoZ